MTYETSVFNTLVVQNWEAYDAQTGLLMPHMDELFMLTLHNAMINFQSIKGGLNSIGKHHKVIFNLDITMPELDIFSPLSLAKLNDFVTKYCEGNSNDVASMKVKFITLEGYSDSVEANRGRGDEIFLNALKTFDFKNYHEIETTFERSLDNEKAIELLQEFRDTRIVNPISFFQMKKRCFTVRINASKHEAKDPRTYLLGLDGSIARLVAVANFIMVDHENQEKYIRELCPNLEGDKKLKTGAITNSKSIIDYHLLRDYIDYFMEDENNIHLYDMVVNFFENHAVKYVFPWNTCGLLGQSISRQLEHRDTIYTNILRDVDYPYHDTTSELQKSFNETFKDYDPLAVHYTVLEYLNETAEDIKILDQFDPRERFYFRSFEVQCICPNKWYMHPDFQTREFTYPAVAYINIYNYLYKQFGGQGHYLSQIGERWNMMDKLTD